MARNRRTASIHNNKRSDHESGNITRRRLRPLVAIYGYYFKVKLKTIICYVFVY